MYSRRCYVSSEEQWVWQCWSRVSLLILSLNRPGNDASILRISALNATLRIGLSSSLQDMVQCGISVLRLGERLLRWVILRLNWIDRPVFFLYGFLITHHFDNSVFTCAFTALIPLHHSLSCARTSPINHFLRRLAPSSRCFHYFPSRWCRIFSCLKRGDCGIILQLFESKSIHPWPNQVDSRLPYLSIPIPIHETSNSLNQYLSPILAGKYLQVQHFFISFITRFIKSFKFGPASNKYVSWRQIHPIATNQGKKESIPAFQATRITTLLTEAL